MEILQTADNFVRRKYHVKTRRTMVAPEGPLTVHCGGTVTVRTGSAGSPRMPPDSKYKNALGPIVALL